MNGTVRKRGSKWACYWYTHRKKENGDYERKSRCGFPDKKSAEAYLRERINEVENGIFIDNKFRSLSDFLDYWLPEYSEQKSLAQNTINGYRNNIEKHIKPIIGYIALDKLQPTDIDRLLKSLRNKGLSGTSQKYVYATLRKALNYAVKHRIIKDNVVLCVDVPKKSEFVPAFIDDKQIKQLLNALHDTSCFLPIMFCLLLGLRRGETLGLKWTDFDFVNNTVHIQRTLTPNKDGYIASTPKTHGSNRTLLLPDLIVSELLVWLELQQSFPIHNSDGYVFAMVNGKVIPTNTLRDGLNNALDKCGLPHIRIHDLRHSFASLMNKNNVPIKTISEMLGHSGIRITLDTYTHSKLDMQSCAMDVISSVIK